MGEGDGSLMPQLCTDWVVVPYADLTCTSKWTEVPYSDDDCEDLWTDVVTE